MRRKSLNPKKLSTSDTKDLRLGTKNVKPSEPDSTEKFRLMKTQSCAIEPEVNNNLNGSEREGKAVIPRSNQLYTRSSAIFTFEGVPFVNPARKCSCHVVKKDQCTQTPSSVNKWFNNATTPSAVNATPVEPSLPSPSWSQSSDSEGSLPRTPNKVRQYKCGLCQKAFPTPSKLRRHFLIHSGEKPYSCRVCGKPFNDPANLKRHHWSHIKEKPFICQECNGKFMTKRDAMMHLCPAVKRKRKLEMKD